MGKEHFSLSREDVVGFGGFQLIVSLTKGCLSRHFGVDKGGFPKIEIVEGDQSPAVITDTPFGYAIETIKFPVADVLEKAERYAMGAGPLRALTPNAALALAVAECTVGACTLHMGESERDAIGDKAMNFVAEFLVEEVEYPAGE